MNKKKYILCVDDDKAILENLKTLLQDTFDSEYLCEVAQSGIEALELIEELYQDNFEPVILITDWMMPQMNGGELIDLFSQKGYYHIPKIILTGQADENEMAICLDKYCDCVDMQKPWDHNELVSLIQTKIENAESDILV